MPIELTKRREEMATDEKVLDTIKQLIKEIKQEMQHKKVLTEGKTPEQIFNKHEKDMKRYITEAVISTLKNAEK